MANAFVMFAAGFETVSTAISFCLHELALKKRIQDRVREEIKLNKSKHNGAVNNEFLLDLNYLDTVLSGTIRVGFIFSKLLYDHFTKRRENVRYFLATSTR